MPAIAPPVDDHGARRNEIFGERPEAGFDG
jgi:hypothetical protein